LPCAFGRNTAIPVFAQTLQRLGMNGWGRLPWGGTRQSGQPQAFCRRHPAAADNARATAV